jgi:endonuclease/exonuclease/phosphatase (EEP) superfamily protein YafD
LTKRPGDEQDNYLKREESVRQLLAHVRDMEMLFQGRISGVIVGGDFNTNDDGQSGDKSISMMVNVGFHNTWSDTPAEGRHTWRGSRQHRPTTLDYIFTKGIFPLRALIFPTSASDHKPVAVWVPISELTD